MASIPQLNLSFIKKQRKLFGITHQQMADQFQFKNASTYFKYENGTYFFKAIHLPLLAELLQCRMEDFFEFEREKMKDVGNVIE